MCKTVHQHGKLDDDTINLLMNLKKYSQKLYKERRLKKGLYSILNMVSKELIRNGHSEYALDILESEDKIGVEKYIEFKTEKMYLYALALIETKDSENEKKAYEIINYYACRPYLFPDITKLGPYLYLSCCININRGNFDKLAYQLKILTKTLAGRENSFLLRSIQQMGGIKTAFREIPSLDMPTKALMSLVWNTQRISSMGVLPGIIAHGFHLFQVIWMRFQQIFGTNKLWLLPPSAKKTQNREKKSILVTRAIGGIGDLLMMTPGLRCLYNKHSSMKIHFAIPKQYHCLFEENPYVIVKDIHDDYFDTDDYSALYNLTQCPASRVESHSLPSVKVNRIEIFAKAMGLSKKYVHDMDKKPFYKLKKEEIEWAKRFFEEHGLLGHECIAIQPFAEDSYRNYEKIEELAKKLALKKKVLVFHDKEFKGFDAPNIIKIYQFPLRKSIALLSRCDNLWSIDSSFIHIAAALDIPTTALFGPIDGELRTSDYPHCHVASTHLQHNFPCAPCWRNRDIVCGRTLTSESACLKNNPEDYIS